MKREYHRSFGKLVVLEVEVSKKIIYVILFYGKPSYRVRCVDVDGNTVDGTVRWYDTVGGYHSRLTSHYSLRVGCPLG